MRQAPWSFRCPEQPKAVQTPLRSVLPFPAVHSTLWKTAASTLRSSRFPVNSFPNPAFQHFFHGILLRLFSGKLMGKIRSRFRTCPGAIGIVLSVIEMSVGLSPVQPALRMNMFSQFALQKYRFCPFFPGTSQIDASLRAVTCQLTFMQHVPIRKFRMSGCRCHITIDRGISVLRGTVPGLFGKNSTLLKISGAGAENKIHIPLQKAVPV